MHVRSEGEDLASKLNSLHFRPLGPLFGKGVFSYTRAASILMCVAPFTLAGYVEKAYILSLQKTITLSS